MALSLRRAWTFGLVLGLVALAGCSTPPLGPRGPCTASRDKVMEKSFGGSLKDPPPNGTAQVRGTMPDAAPVIQQVSHTTPPPPPDANVATYKVRPCAWINGKPLFEGELYNIVGHDLAKVAGLTEPERSVKRKQILEKGIDHLIDQEVVYQDAVRKLEKSPQFMDKLKDMARKQFNQRVWKDREKLGLTEFEYKKVLEMQGSSLEALQRYVERDFIVSEYMRSRVVPIADKVGHQEIRDYYETHLNEFQTTDRIEWEDIFILVGGKRAPTLDYARQLAAYVKGRMEVGVSIDELLQYDDGDSSTRKGRGYGERRGEIRPHDLEQYLFSMKPGQVGPPVELPTGIHVFRLLKREYASQMPFNETVQAKIRAKLKNDIARKEFERIVRQLRSRTVIEVNPDVLR